MIIGLKLGYSYMNFEKNDRNHKRPTTRYPDLALVLIPPCKMVGPIEFEPLWSRKRYLRMQKSILRTAIVTETTEPKGVETHMIEG